MVEQSQTHRDVIQEHGSMIDQLSRNQRTMLSRTSSNTWGWIKILVYRPRMMLTND